MRLRRNVRIVLPARLVSIFSEVRIADGISDYVQPPWDLLSRGQRKFKERASGSLIRKCNIEGSEEKRRGIEVEVRRRRGVVLRAIGQFGVSLSSRVPL